jgi:hydrogenase nickel incorporation protein HypA/HybF
MHELSVAHAIVSTVVEAVPADASVEVVRVRVGAMSGVVATALEYAWDVATVGSRIDGSRIEIETIPVSIRCQPCGRVTQPTQGVRCPECGTPSGDFVAGRELELVSVDLSEEAIVS